MLLTQHIVNPNKVARASDLASGFYAIGLTLEKFLDLFSDVKSFAVEGLSIIDSTLTQNFAASDIREALLSVENFNDASTIARFAGSSRRRMIPLGRLEYDGSESALSKTPNTFVDYPYHSAGGSGGLVEIDFGRTLMYAGLFYPYIKILFSTGMGSASLGNIIGYASFHGYGQIPLFSGTAPIGLTQNFASASISISERFSSLRAQSLSVRAGDTLIFSSIGALRSLTDYTVAYLGSARAAVESSARQMSFIVPLNAKSGPVRFTSTGPQYDFFLSYDEIKLISS